MRGRSLVALVLALVAVTPRLAVAQSLGGEPPATDLRLDLSQLYSLDDVTSRHLSFSELRATGDLRRDFGESRLELHLDGRGRYGWTEITDHRVDVTRAAVAFGAKDKSWTLALGRQVIDAVNASRVDGLSADFGLGEVHLVGFGGAMPHPLTGDPDPSFLIFGAGYDARTQGLQHFGGLAASLYQGGLDRLYLTERAFWRISREWMVQGYALVDLVAPRGLFSNLDTPIDEQSAVDHLDLTSAHLTVRWTPISELDLSLYGAHTHTLLPNLWWDDYLAEQRALRGFVLDGADPVGSRRSTARFVANVHVANSVTPYLVGRTDYRHEDGATGFDGTLGLKVDDVEIGYVDLSASARDYFGAANQLATLALGTSFGIAAGFDANASMLRVVPAEAPEAQLLFDVGGTAWMDLKTLMEELGDLRLMAVYQAFIDPDMVFQVFFLRIGYRFRSKD